MIAKRGKKSADVVVFKREFSCIHIQARFIPSSFHHLKSLSCLSVAAGLMQPVFLCRPDAGKTDDLYATLINSDTWAPNWQLTESLQVVAEGSDSSWKWRNCGFRVIAWRDKSQM